LELSPLQALHGRMPASDSVTDDVFVLDCGTFEVWDQFELNSSGKLFLDEDGNPLRVVQHVWGSDTLYNHDTGKSLYGTINAGEIVDFVDGQAIESGQLFHIVSAGDGAVMVDVGRLIVTFGDGISLKGRHPFFEATPMPSARRWPSRSAQSASRTSGAHTARR
jgi:hypothetical protein